MLRTFYHNKKMNSKKKKKKRMGTAIEFASI